MIRHRRLSRHLLEDSEDALRRVAAMLDDALSASPFDLHMALGMLDRVYELESAADAHAVGVPDRPGHPPPEPAGP